MSNIKNDICKFTNGKSFVLQLDYVTGTKSIVYVTLIPSCAEMTKLKHGPLD